MTKLLPFIVASVFATVGLVADSAALIERGELAVSTAAACQVNCGPVTAVKKGTKVPVWKVDHCVIGPAGGPYTRIDCRDPNAVHMGPFGKPATCFVGTDNKIHWATPENVVEGRRFINHQKGGHWYVDWQS